MRTNFEIEENYAINFNGIHIDLHNNFDLKKILEIDDSIQIEFNKTKGDWVNKDEFDKIILHHKNVTYKKMSIDKLNPSKNLNEITFYPKAFREKNNEIMSQSKPKENDDVIYIFENGKYIRLNCQEIQLVAV